MQEIFERRLRWTVRQALAGVDETRILAEQAKQRRAERSERECAALVTHRPEALHAFFSLVDSAIGAFSRGPPFPAGEAPAAGRLATNSIERRKLTNAYSVV